MTTTEIVPVTDQKAIEEIYLSDGLMKQIEIIKKDAENFVADISTGAGRKECKSKAFSIAKQKGVIDKAGKDLGAEYRLNIQKINDVRNNATKILGEVQEKVRKPLTEWEMEQDRIKQEKRDLVELEMAMEEGIAENELFDRQKEVERREAELEAKEEERLAKECAEQEEKERIKREARIATEARERAEREAKESIEAEKRATIEAEFKAKQDAERAEREKKETAKRVELEKQEAIDLAKREEIERQERERSAQEEDARITKEIEDRKAANKAHQKKIRVEALKSFKENGVGGDVAGNVTALIVAGVIKHVTINY